MTTLDINQFIYKTFRRLRIKTVKPLIKKGSIVCDVGCGPSAQMLKDLGDHISFGVGIDRAVTEEATDRLKIKRQYIDTKLPLDDNFVDVVTMLASLEHIEKDAEILRECLRILHPGGKILITVPTIWNRPIGEFCANVLHMKVFQEYYDHKRYYDKKKLCEDLRLAGFKNIRARYWEFGLNLFAEAYK